MKTIVYCIALCLVLPVALLCIFLERRARRVVLAFISGVAICLLAYLFNNSVTSTMSVSPTVKTSVVYPVVEEILKYIPILIFSFVLNKGLKGSTAIAFSVGVGFCVVENFFYLYSDLTNANILWIVIRCVGTGLMHSMSASILGLGLYFARLKKGKWTVLAVAMFFAAVVYHGLYNFMVQSAALQWIGILIPAATCVAVYFISHRAEIHRYWTEE